MLNQLKRKGTFMLQTIRTWTGLLLVVLMGNALAQVSADHLPSAGGLAKLLGTDAATVNREVVDSGGAIASGIRAGDGARGETAKVIARLLAGGAPERAQQLQDAFMAEREGFEAYLEQNNFALNDVGVAYGAAFVLFWGYGTGQENAIGEEASFEAAKFAIYAVKTANSQLAGTSQQEKDQAYDWLMTTPVVFGALVRAFEEAGKQEEAAQLRKKMAEMFQQLFLFPPDVYTISAEGKVGIDADKLLEFKASHNGSSEVDALIDEVLGGGSP